MHLVVILLLSTLVNAALITVKSKRFQHEFKSSSLQIQFKFRQQSGNRGSSISSAYV